MNLNIELPDELGHAIQARVHAQGVSPDRYASQVLEPTVTAESLKEPSVKPFKTGYGMWSKYGPAPSAEEIDENRARDVPQLRPRVLMTAALPGVDVTVAQTIAAALSDVTRFADADRAAAYLGLVPSTRQSGEHCYHGRITKQGASHARLMLVQAAQQVGRHPGPLGVFFRRFAKRKNRNVAVVATARKLVTIAWQMLKNNEPYRYAQPKTVDAKLSRLRIRVTGRKKKGGTAKGQLRSASYGSGQRNSCRRFARYAVCQ